MYFYRNRKYIPCAYPVYPYSEYNYCYTPMFHTKNNFVIIIMHIYNIIINVLYLLLKKYQWIISERQRFNSTDSHCLRCWVSVMAEMRSPKIGDVTWIRRIIYEQGLWHCQQSKTFHNTTHLLGRWWTAHN